MYVVNNQCVIPAYKLYVCFYLYFADRFRVVDNTFVDTTPVGPENVSKDSDVTEHEVKKSPYTITVSVFD
jgi:hypothetical protein